MSVLRFELTTKETKNTKIEKANDFFYQDANRSYLITGWERFSFWVFPFYC